MVITQKLIKTYKEKGKYNKKVTTIMLLTGTLYIVMLYIIGIYVGFYSSIVKLSIRSVFTYIIPYIVIIVSIENIRKTILLKKNNKSNIIIILIVTVILDIALEANIYNLKTVKDYFLLTSFTIFSSIANNMLYNYIILNYRNCKAIIGYRIITTIYQYIIPIMPNIHLFYKSLLGIIVPFIIYTILQTLYTKKVKHISTATKTRNIINTSILVIITAGIIMLISCKFKYGALVIGSGSMAGTLNKGDTIIYEELDEDEEIEIGEIIVFIQDNVRIIHRVIDKKEFGTGTRYYTKGDANSTSDDEYRVREDIIGKTRLRIPYIGQLTLMINEAIYYLYKKRRIR